MEQPVKDGISQGGIPNGVMPVVHRELTGDNRRPSPVPIFQEFEHITSVLVGARTAAQLEGSLAAVGVSVGGDLLRDLERIFPR